MLATSTGDLAACREAIAFAQLAEVPLVLVHTQRLDAGLAAAPLLGDGDVVLARHLGIAGLLLPVFAAPDAASARMLVKESIEIANRLQAPIIVLLSADSPAKDVIPDRAATVRKPHFGRPVSYDHGSDQTEATAPTLDAATRPGCVSFAGDLDGRRVFLNVREDQVDVHLRRLRDKVTNAGELPERTVADPDPDAETLLVSYGAADQAARQAVRIVRESKARVSHLTVHSLWPLPQRALKRAVTPFVRRVLLPELNMGLYAEELSKVLRFAQIESLTRYDGRPIEPETIARRITDWPCG